MNTAELREVLEKGRVPLADVARVIAFHKGRDAELDAAYQERDDARIMVRDLELEAARRASEPSEVEVDLAAKLDAAQRRCVELETRVRRLVQDAREASVAAATVADADARRLGEALVDRDAALAEVESLRARRAQLEAQNAALSGTLDEAYRGHLEQYERLEREAKEADEAATERVRALVEWQTWAREVLTDLLADSARTRHEAVAPARELLAAT